MATLSSPIVPLSWILSSACGTAHPAPISGAELAEAEAFPYYRIYWVGRRFLNYLQRKDLEGYRALIKELGLRR